MGIDAWPPAAVEIVRGDLMAAFAYTTPFGGVSLSPVCPFGMLDEDAATIVTSVPLAFTDKLRRLAAAPQAALAFFRRDHGMASAPGFVLAQGDVSFPDAPPPGHLAELHERWAQHLGPVPTGGLVRKLGGDAYYDHRTPVALHVRRISYWPDEKATGTPIVAGDPAPVQPPPPQRPPKAGTEPLVAPGRYAKQLRRVPDHLLGFVDGKGHPTVLPIVPVLDGDRLRVDRDDVPPGGRRASLLGFWYERQLHGQGALVARGWLDATDDGATFAPSACRSFNLPKGSFGPKVIVPIALGFQHRKAERSGAVRDGSFVRPR